jgi:hypothetical protein
MELNMSTPKAKTIIISQSSKANTEMVVIKTPIKGVKNRKGEQAYTSVTKHRHSKASKEIQKSIDEKWQKFKQRTK